MTIAREELIVGGRCFFKTRPTGLGGLNTAWKLQSVTVKKVERGAATIEFDDGRSILASFKQLEADENFLDERERKEQQKKDRIQRERLLSEQLADGTLAAPTLTYTLEEKLRATERDDDAEEQGASEDERAAALKQIEALKFGAPKPEPVVEPEPEPAPVMNLDEKRDMVARVRAYQTLGTAPNPPTLEPVPEGWPEPSNADVQVQLDRIAAVVAKPAPKSPLDAMLEKIQAELETLIAEEATLDAQVRELEALKERLVKNQARQKVLAAQERAVLGMKRPAAPETAPEPVRAAPEPAPERPPVAVTHLPPHPPKRGRGRPPGSKNKPKPGMSHTFAPPDTSKLGPSWLRRRVPSAAAE